MTFRFAFCTVLLTMLSACATGKDIQSVGYDIEIIKTKHGADLATLKVLQKRNTDSLSTVVSNQADMKNEMNNLGVTMENLTAKAEESTFYSQKVLKELEDTNRRIGNLTSIITESNLKNRKNEEERQAALDAQITELKARIESIEAMVAEIKQEKENSDKEKKERERLKAEAKKKEEERKKAEALEKAKTKPIPKNITAEDLYQSAYTNFMDERYNQAGLEFMEYIKRFPKTELAANSQYWAAEALAKTGSKKDSVSAFLNVEKNYPSSDKVPSALLRAAELYLNLKENKKAEETYVKIRDNYPESTEAATAQEWLNNQQEKKEK